MFGAPLAIEGLMAFFLEATFVGLFFFAWDRLSKVQHLIATWALAIGTNFSALWILIANGWMQYPVGAKFNVDTMRMEVTDFMAVLFNPVAQAKFVHTVSAGYVTGSVFVLAISAYYLLRGRHVEFAKRSMTVAASFGLASALSVVVLGDESGYTAGINQKMKIAAIEAMWNTEPAPASFTVFGLPDLANHTTHYEVKVPWVLGLIATRSVDTPVPGINQLVAVARHAHQRRPDRLSSALQAIKAHPHDAAATRACSMPMSQILVYALLLKQFRARYRERDARTRSAVPQPAPSRMCRCCSGRFASWWGLGFWFIALFASAFWLSAKRQLDQHRSFLRAAVLTLAAAMDCRGARLDRGGIWPPALGDRRRAADGAWRVVDGMPAMSCSVLWVCAVLFGASRRRSLSARESISGSDLTLSAAAHSADVRLPRSNAMLDYETLRVIWWALLGILLIGFAIMDGFDLGTARSCPFCCAYRRRAPRRDQHGRTRMGRQSGLVHLGRRGDFRSLAGTLCRQLFRLLSCHVSGAWRR